MRFVTQGDLLSIRKLPMTSNLVASDIVLVLDLRIIYTSYLDRKGLVYMEFNTLTSLDAILLYK